MALNAVEFGRYVTKLRRSQMPPEGSNQEMLGWTRAYLGELAGGLTEKQIYDIETGKSGLRNLSSYLDKVERLGKAFHLSEHEKVAFYAKAGFVYKTDSPILDEAFLKHLLVQTTFPVIARTKLWDIVAFNTYYMTVFGYTDKVVNQLRTEDLGTNLLRLLFKPAPTAYSYLNRPFWREQTVWSFKLNSFPYIHTERYNLIVDTMKRTNPFKHYWDSADPSASEQDEQKYLTTTIKHEEFGQIALFSLRIPSIYLPEFLIISLYVPTIESEGNYAKLRETVRHNEVAFFDPLPLGYEK